MKSVSKIELSTFDVMKILGLERERLREWMHYDFITITQKAMGRGTKAIFNLLDVYNVAIFKNLVDAGINRNKAKIYMKNKKELNCYEDAKELKYILFFEGDSYESFQISKEKHIDLDELGNFSDPNESWNLGIVINFKKLRDKIDRAIDSL